MNFFSKKVVDNLFLNSYVYPQWYSDSVVMSPTYGHEEDFVGSGPLFPVCPNAEKAKKEFQEKTFGYLVRLLQFC